MKLSIIVAVATNGVIGAGGGLPWHLPEDLRRFRAITMGKPIVMGRATYESVGRPLPGRRNIVLSRQAAFAPPGCEVVSSPAAAIELASGAEELMIIGGGDVYRQFLPLAHRVYLSRVHLRATGDTHFPPLDPDEWRLVSAEEFPADANCPTGFTLQVLERQ